MDPNYFTGFYLDGAHFNFNKGCRMFSPGFPLLLLENKRESELPGETKGGEEENPNHANLSAGTIVVV